MRLIFAHVHQSKRVNHPSGLYIKHTPVCMRCFALVLIISMHGYTLASACETDTGAGLGLQIKQAVNYELKLFVV